MQNYAVNPFDLRASEVDYQISRLTPCQIEILMHLVEGKRERDILPLLNINLTTLRSRLLTACDRVGVKTRWQLIGLFAIWKYLRRGFRG